MLFRDTLANSKIFTMKTKSRAIDYTDKDMPKLLERAKRIIVEEQKCSFALLQRRLKTGYMRTAELMDMLETAGVIGPAKDDVHSPRTILGQERC